MSSKTMKEQARQTGEYSKARYASLRWGKDIIGVPAMIMALGVFLLYAGRFFFEGIVGSTVANQFILLFSYGLGLFTVFVTYLFLIQLKRDGRVLWDFTADHFRMGTWVAGLSVLSSLFKPIDLSISKIIFGLSCVLWMSYMIWLVKMVFQGVLRRGILTGVVFLTTVATQSLVVNFIKVFPESVSGFIYGLISLNVLGIVFYWISFALMWVAQGVIEPLIQWVPQNNITHGALSITMLAAQMIEDNMPGTLPYFHFVIQVAWVIAALFFLSSFFYEVYVLVSGKKPLLVFQISNYARNFTYGMFFACSYYGYTYSHPSIMKSALNPTILLILAVIVVLVNVWELGHHIFISALARQSAKVNIS